MAQPYATGMTVTPVQGMPNVVTAPPSTQSISGTVSITISYEAITIPTEETTMSRVTVTGGGDAIILVKDQNNWGFVVEEISSPIAHSAPLSNSMSTARGRPNSGATTTSASTIGVPTGETASSSTSAPPAATTSPAGKAVSGNKSATAAAGVMGGLFAITLVALLFLIFKLRKARKDSSHPPPMMEFTEASAEKDRSPISELSATNANLMSQLEERNAQLSALQATLMRSSSVPPSLDDRSIASRFKQIEQELKDWVIIHFKSTEQRLDLSPQLRDILISQIPLFDRLLQQPKSRTMVLRAVAGHVIQKAFENGEFVGVGEGLGSLERSVGGNIPETEFNKWRSQTFLIFSKASTTESKAHVVAAISQRIDSLLSPFSTTSDQQERLHFLYRIVESAATLSLDLGCQLAKFKVLSDPAETPFDSAHMEDVYQEHETQVNPHTGKSVNALDGKIIQAVVFPSVIKWGDERGENYEEMKVILKAKVLA